MKLLVPGIMLQLHCTFPLAVPAAARWHLQNAFALAYECMTLTHTQKKCCTTKLLTLLVNFLLRKLNTQLVGGIMVIQSAVLITLVVFVVCSRRLWCAAKMKDDCNRCFCS